MTEVTSVYSHFLIKLASRHKKVTIRDSILDILHKNKKKGQNR
ncbi:TPA: hypothetical protein ACSRFV_001893 [Clostridioides difficile]